MTARKTCFLISLGAFIFTFAVGYAIASTTLNGLPLLVLIVLVALGGLTTFLTFAAALSSKPGEAIQDGILDFIIMTILGH